MVLAGGGPFPSQHGAQRTIRKRENPKIFSEKCQNTGKSGKNFEASLRNCRHGFDLSTFEENQKDPDCLTVASGIYCQMRQRH